MLLQYKHPWKPTVLCWILGVEGECGGNILLWKFSPIKILFISAERLVFFFTKFCRFDLSFNINIVIHLYIKHETISAYVQNSVSRYYILQISWHNMKLQRMLGTLFDNWNWSMMLSTWPRDSFGKYF